MVCLPPGVSANPATQASNTKEMVFFKAERLDGVADMDGEGGKTQSNKTFRVASINHFSETP